MLETLTWRRRGVAAALVLAAALYAAPVQAGQAALAERDAAEAFQTVRSALGAPDRLRLQVAPESSGQDFRLQNEKFVLPMRALRLARSKEELAGLYVVALAAQLGDRSDKARSLTAAEYVAAGAVAIAGEALDRIPHGADRDQRRNYDAPIPGHRPVNVSRGGALVRALARSGTCTAPALHYLDRLAREMRSPAAALLAKSARQALGTLAYPPEESCAGFV